MPTRRHSSEQIISKLREAEVHFSHRMSQRGNVGCFYQGSIRSFRNT